MRKENPFQLVKWMTCRLTDVLHFESQSTVVTPQSHSCRQYKLISNLVKRVSVEILRKSVSQKTVPTWGRVWPSGKEPAVEVSTRAIRSSIKQGHFHTLPLDGYSACTPRPMQCQSPVFRFATTCSHINKDVGIKSIVSIIFQDKDLQDWDEDARGMEFLRLGQRQKPTKVRKHYINPEKNSKYITLYSLYIVLYN